MFLGEPPASEARDAAFNEDLDADGYVNNHTRLWCWRPDLRLAFMELRTSLMGSSALTDRDWAVLVTATASECNDSYCSLAWGARLAGLTDDETAARLIAGDPAPGLSDRESVLASWAREVVRDPNTTTEGQIEHLREAGLSDMRSSRRQRSSRSASRSRRSTTRWVRLPTSSWPKPRRVRFEPR